MGKLIVLEGLDGSGKATQTKMLYDHYKPTIENLRCVTFPDYDSRSSALVRMYLDGEFGADPHAVNAYAASSFYAVDRYASYQKIWQHFYQEGGIVLADRYTTSNVIHQGVKLPADERATFVDWLTDFEYNKLEIPRPDAVLYLHVTPAVNARQMAERNRQEGRSDIHEEDTAYMHRCYETALWAEKRQHWQRVDCDDGYAMLPKQTITQKIIKILEEQYGF